MKPATLLSFVLLVLIAVLHALRLAFRVDVVAGGIAIPVWWSAPALVFAAALAVGLWREHRSA